jgi:predicted nuclease of predicted toxin-antitoxin system
MHLLVDENIPGEAVASLKANGHDVVWIRDAAPGSTDDDVFALAMNETRILLTFGKDFGELAWRRRQAGICGVILFRLRMPAGAGRRPSSSGGSPSGTIGRDIFP